MIHYILIIIAGVGGQYRRIFGSLLAVYCPT